MVVGGLIAAVLTMFLIVPDQEREDRILQDGDRVTATVVSGAAASATGGRRVHFGSITVEYDYGGRRYRGVLTATLDSPRVEDGDSLTVFVDPRNPARIAADGFDTASPWRTLIELLGFSGGLGVFCAGLLLLLWAPFARRRSRRSTTETDGG